MLRLFLDLNEMLLVHQRYTFVMVVNQTLLVNWIEDEIFILQDPFNQFSGTYLDFNSLRCELPIYLLNNNCKPIQFAPKFNKSRCHRHQ